MSDQLDDNIPIHQLGLDDHTHRILTNAGFQTVGELYVCSDSDLLRVRNFGQKALDEVRRKLRIPTLSDQQLVSRWSLRQQKAQAEAYDTLTRIEDRIRNFIFWELHRVYDEEWWKKGVPEIVHTRTVGRLTPPDSNVRSVESLGHVDFGHYKTIILEENNWQSIFSNRLRNAASVENHLDVINRIRRSIAHSRRLTTDEFNRLWEEVRYVDRAFRIRKNYSVKSETQP